MGSKARCAMVRLTLDMNFGSHHECRDPMTTDGRISLLLPFLVSPNVYRSSLLAFSPLRAPKAALEFLFDGKMFCIGNAETLSKGRSPTETQPPWDASAGAQIHHSKRLTLMSFCHTLWPCDALRDSKLTKKTKVAF